MYTELSLGSGVVSGRAKSCRLAPELCLLQDFGRGSSEQELIEYLSVMIQMLT